MLSFAKICPKQEVEQKEQNTKLSKRNGITSHAKGHARGMKQHVKQLKDPGSRSNKRSGATSQARGAKQQVEQEEPNKRSGTTSRTRGVE